jgi:site-specific DNA-methyltransferase (adenine-specific)
MNAYQPDTIIHGDCVRILPALPAGSVDFVLSDPPYLTSYTPRDGRTVPGDDNDAWLKPAFAGIYRALQPDSFCVTFYGWPHADRFVAAFRAAGFRPVGHLTFTKPYSSTAKYLRGHHECAYLLAKGYPRRPGQPISDVIPWAYSGNKLHPTQKPLSVLSPLVEAFSAPGDLVLDAFAGSGSTLVAAQSLGRRYLGIEIDAGYHAAAARRLEQAAAPSRTEATA